jgi:hypothetical protein
VRRHQVAEAQPAAVRGRHILAEEEAVARGGVVEAELLVAVVAVEGQRGARRQAVPVLLEEEQGAQKGRPVVVGEIAHGALDHPAQIGAAGQGEPFGEDEASIRLPEA